MKESRLIALLITTLLLSRAWFLFSDEHQYMIDFWAMLGVDITDKYQLWVFVEDVWEKLKWYGHDSGYLVSFPIFLYIIKKTAVLSRKTMITVNVFYYFSIFRVIEYWLYRFHIGLTYVSFGIILFALINYDKRHDIRDHI